MIPSTYFLRAILLFTMLSFNTATKADTLELGTGDWCPISCDPITEDGKKGYIVDILIAIFKKNGHQINENYHPFNRNIKLARNGLLDMLAGVYKADVPDFNFSDSPQGLVVDTFYTKTSTNWQFTDIKSLRTAGSIAVISGYAYGGGNSNFKAFLATHPQQVSEIFGDKPLEKSINLLIKGRVDTFIETKQVAQYHLMKMGVNNQVRAAGSFKKIIPVYVAFSPALPLSKAQQYKNILTQGIIELRQSGELALILNKYGIQDWVD